MFFTRQFAQNSHSHGDQMSQTYSEEEDSIREEIRVFKNKMRQHQLEFKESLRLQQNSIENLKSEVSAQMDELKDCISELAQRKVAKVKL